MKFTKEQTKEISQRLEEIRPNWREKQGQILSNEIANHLSLWVSDDSGWSYSHNGLESTPKRINEMLLKVLNWIEKRSFPDGSIRAGVGEANDLREILKQPIWSDNKTRTATDTE